MSDRHPASSAPVTVLSDGIPTLQGSRHGRYTWPKKQPPVRLLNDDFDLLWIVRGTAAMQLESGQRIFARENELILLPPLVAGTISQHAGRLVFWYCHFDFRQSPGRAAAPVAITLKLPRRRAQSIIACYDALNRITGNDSHNAWLREAALIQLVAALAHAGQKRGRRDALPPPLAPRIDARVAKIRDQIEENPAARWRVLHLAQSVNLTPGHFHALWASALGCSVKSYIVRARLRLAMSQLRAKSPLTSSRPAIKQVAATCGFSSQHLFCRQFRGTFGITPSDFRDSAGL